MVTIFRASKTTRSAAMPISGKGNSKAKAKTVREETNPVNIIMIILSPRNVEPTEIPLYLLYILRLEIKFK